jgi:poly(A) polymerase
VRSIGDPDVRLREDPVRMIRAIALASRLGFTIDSPVLAAIRRHRREIAQSSPPRLLEEYYKILRAGASEKSFRWLAEVGLLEPISRELHRGATDTLWRSLAALDKYRKQFESTPDTLTNSILLGSLLVPLGIPLQPLRRPDAAIENVEEDAEAEAPVDAHSPKRRRPPVPKLGELPLARRDVERLQQVIGLQRRLRETTASLRAQRTLAHRHIFREALTWLEIHGGVPDVVEHWKTLLAENPPEAGATEEGAVAGEAPAFKRRRRRRRRRGPST